MNEVTERMRLVLLGFWIDLAERAGIPYVPAEFSEPVSMEDVMLWNYGEPAPRIQPILDWHKARIDNMLANNEKLSVRWECCSSSEAKLAASKGKGWSEEYYRLYGGDPRIEEAPFGCLVGDSQRLCVRPWIDALRIDGYPVEFRVFYGSDSLLGVSNYYPQRRLCTDSVLLGYVDKVKKLSEKLFNAESFPVGFTADFIIKQDGEAVFLEGGPPYAKDLVSAHPCCFEGKEIEGIAL